MRQLGPGTICIGQDIGCKTDHSDAFCNSKGVSYYCNCHGCIPLGQLPIEVPR